MEDTIRDIQDRIDNGYSDTQRAAYYVTMTDKVMSGWGHANNRINKLIFLCDDMDQAMIVEQNAINRGGDMKYINICANKPYYNKTRYYAQIKTISDYPHWYEVGYFKG